MKSKKWKIGVLCITILFLLLTSWVHRRTSHSVTTNFRETDVFTDEISQGAQAATNISELGGRTKLAVEDCVTCPELKRQASMPTRERFRRCESFLQEAATAGIPNPDTTHLDGCRQLTPLHVSRDTDDVRTLLNAGADPNVQDWIGRTPLHLAVVGYKDPAIITALLEAGADPDVKDQEGRDVLTALRQRPDWDQRNVVRIMLNDEIRAEKLGFTIEEFYQEFPDRRTEITDYYDRNDIDDIRLQVQISKAGKAGRISRRLQDMSPFELIALREQLAENPQAVITNLERGVE